MNILLSLITSGGIKWLSILILVTGLVVGLYSKHRQIVDLEKQSALQQYNINQLQQNVKDKDLYIQKMEEINKSKNKIVSDLYVERDKLEQKLKEIESSIDIEVGKGNDRPSSNILKETIRKLSQ